MICPSCGTKNNYYHRYCYYCGNKLNQPESIDNQDTNRTGMSLDDLDVPLFSSSVESEFDYTQQIPLRRYRKSKPQPGPGD